MSDRLQQVGFFVLLLFAFVPSFLTGFTRESPRTFRISKAKEIKPQMADVALYREDFVHPPKITSFVHSPALTEMTNGNLMAVWYGGSGEKESDVALYMSIYDREEGHWTDSRLITNRDQSQAELGRYVYTIGNPVLLTDSRGIIWLFYVTASLPGWSSSSINLKASSDGGKTWTPAKRLISHPFLNVATLVRGVPFLYTDGSIGLPVYHDFLGLFPELLQLSADGIILHKTRMHYGRSSLQPSIIPMDERRAIALLRPGFTLWQKALPEPSRVLEAHTSDGGQHWTRPVKLALANPGSSVMGVRISDGSILLVFNNSTTARDDLSLAISSDSGNQWKVIYTFEHGGPGAKFSYPYIIQAEDGRIHLVYAWKRSLIKHVVFNEVWIKRITP